MAEIPIAIFASGRGSGFDAIERAIRQGHLEARIVAVVSDQPKAAVLEKARAAGLKTVVVPAPVADARSADARRADHERAILAELMPLQPRFLVMAGYMRIVTSELIEAFRSERGYSRIVNIHPSILPAFPGINAYEQAFDYGCRVAGVTVHLVEKEVDGGPILAQETFTIADCQSVAEVEARGLKVEHRIYTQVLSWVLPEKFGTEVHAGRLCVRTR